MTVPDATEHLLASAANATRLAESLSMAVPHRFTDYPHVPFTARCPGCGQDARWTAALVPVTHALTKTATAGVAHHIDCASCDALEAEAAA